MTRLQRVVNLIQSSILASRSEMPGGSNTLLQNGTEDQADEYLSGRAFADTGHDPMYPNKAKCLGCKRFKKLNDAKFCFFCQNARTMRRMT